MPAGIEFAFWLIFFALILVSLALVTLGEWLRGRSDVLPKPHLRAKVLTGRDYWRVSPGRVRTP